MRRGNSGRKGVGVSPCPYPQNIPGETLGSRGNWCYNYAISCHAGSEVVPMLMNNYFRYRAPLAMVLLFSLAACSVIAPSPTATATYTPEPTLSSTATPTLKPTPPSIPSATLTPTYIPTTTFSPTPPLFAQVGTPLPPLQMPITIENAPQVSGLAEWYELTVTDLAWTPDGYNLAVSNATNVNFYNIQTQQVLRSLYPRNERIVDIEFSPGGTWLVVGTRRGDEDTGYASSMELWLGPDWKPLGFLHGSPRALSNMSFSPAGKLFAAAYTSPDYWQNSVDFWNTLTWTITDTLRTGTALNVAFSPDVGLLAITPDRYAIQVWDLGEEEWLYTLHTSFTGAVNRIVFSPDGLTLASGHYDGTISLWDMRTGEMILVIETEEVIESLAFNSDGRLLASGGSYENSLVRLWSAGSGTLLRTLEGHKNGVNHLLFSPLDQYLVSASYDGSIRLWGVRP